MSEVLVLRVDLSEVIAMIPHAVHALEDGLLSPEEVNAMLAREVAITAMRQIDQQCS